MKEAYEKYDYSMVYKLFMDFMKYYVYDVYIPAIKPRILGEKGTPRYHSAVHTLHHVKFDPPRDSGKISCFVLDSDENFGCHCSGVEF